MNLYSMILYHGSGSTFDKFDFNFMSKGQGAQAHGWGIYLAKDKNTADGYRNAERFKNLMHKVTVDGKVYTTDEFIKLVQSMFQDLEDDDYFVIDNVKSEIFSFVNNYLLSHYGVFEDKGTCIVNVENKIRQVQSDISFYTDRGISNSKTERLNSYLECLGKLLQWLNSHDIRKNENDVSMLATVHLDDDCVLIDETDDVNPDYRYYDILVNIWNKLNHAPYFSDLEDALNEAFNKFLGTPPDSYLYDCTLKPFFENRDIDGLAKWIRRFNWGYNDYNPDVPDSIRIAKVIMDARDRKYEESKIIPDDCQFSTWYRKLEDANSGRDISLALLENGIDGISYNGHQDGECIVLFNLDKCKIIAKE